MSPAPDSTTASNVVDSMDLDQNTVPSTRKTSSSTPPSHRRGIPSTLSIRS
ncbi:hypothetical protein E2C01_087839 [Portunus trituberculatus]|uniref:Uncharacterized protein n=1 Tax=Portunus trituberculatus TaxID=210409 RepID=A0A5B7JEF3_PORTR|nr:hypothetical protein [Portunus trituberculatus]